MVNAAAQTHAKIVVSGAMTMKATVRAGHTLELTGVLSASDTVTVLSGQHGYLPGGLIEVATTATSNGTIDLLAGPAHKGLQGATGGTLQVIRHPLRGIGNRRDVTRSRRAA
jgi:hypothetical protein